MLIPSIDLRGGKVVQLVQGRRLAIEDENVFAWVQKFEAFPRVQLIDLDAALGTGQNTDLVRRICARLPCRVGGGIRTIDRAREALDAGARHVIVGSALFADDGPDLDFAGRLADAIGLEHLIAAVDSLAGSVVVRGWRQSLPMPTVEAVRALDPFAGEFLYTHVDTEGLMGGIDMEAVRRVRNATRRRISAAGGITTRAEIDELSAIGIDAVVGMAIYSETLKIEPSDAGSSAQRS